MMMDGRRGGGERATGRAGGETAHVAAVKSEPTSGAEAASFISEKPLKAAAATKRLPRLPTETLTPTSLPFASFRHSAGRKDREAPAPPPPPPGQ